MRLLIAAALTIGLAVSAQTAEKVLQLKPVDHGPQDKSLLEFRNALKGIVARKDAPALLKTVAPDIRNTFGDTNGAANFVAIWKPADPKSEVWRVLDLVLALGGTFDNKTTFVAPYVFSTFPDDLDAFETVVVTADGAVMRKKPGAAAPIVRTLDHDILTLVGSITKSQHQAGPDDWLAVRDVAGRGGFVRQREVRSAVDFRAYFKKRQGRWRMTILIAGD